MSDSIMKTGNEILTELYNIYQRTLINICISKGLSKADSEDVVSEAFYRFWENIDDLGNLTQAQQKKWLYSAVNNIFYEVIRLKYKTIDTDINDLADIISDKKSDFEIVIEDQEFERLVKLFEAELTNSEKISFRVMLDKESGATYKELSEEYDIPISTLTSGTTRLRKRAKIILKKILKN